LQEREYCRRMKEGFGLEGSKGFAKYLVHLPVYLLTCGREVACVATRGPTLGGWLLVDEARRGVAGVQLPFRVNACTANSEEKVT
jgi:hypothetical protein